MAFSRAALSNGHRHSHRFDMLLVVRESRGPVHWIPDSVAESRLSQAHGQVIIWPAGLPAALEFAGQLQVDAIALATNSTSATSIDSTAATRRLVPRVVKDRFVEHLASACHELSQTDSAGKSDVAVQLGQTLAQHVLGEYSTPCPAIPGDRLTPHDLTLIRDFVDCHLDEALSVQQLADLAGMSESHFSRTFRALSGHSPHQFVLRRRLARVRALIRDGLSLSSAAMAGGFSSQSHMHRHFVRTFGRTPGDYRRAYLSGPGASDDCANPETTDRP